MEISENLAEFVWNYMLKHNYVSRAILAGDYINVFEIKYEGRDERKTLQKSLERRISSIFRITKQFGITERFSQKTVKVNRAIFNKFTLDDVLKFNFKKKQAKIG